MYVKSLETDKDAKASHDASLKVNAKERLAANAAWNKKNKPKRKRAE